ncbi:hypothetical protein Tco_0766045, partial [Tanacetum coccineum]
MEVNACDIVIKSDVEEEMLADIKETLDGLRAINLKLNPKKCSFGIEEGIFLRHLITKQGIKASPSKVKAISDLQPHKSVSEIQNLNKKLAALNRFISKEVDKTLPFMRTLKSCTSGKMVQWTAEADKDFRSTTNGNCTHQRRNPHNVSRSLRRKYKRNIDGREGQETNSRIL